MSWTGLCTAKHCNRVATFNIPGLVPKFCKAHACKDMCTNSFKTCTFGSCLEPAMFGVPGDNLRCTSHKGEEDLCLVLKTCSTCGELFDLYRSESECQSCLDKLKTKIEDFMKGHSDIGKVEQINELAYRLGCEGGSLLCLFYRKIEKEDEHHELTHTGPSIATIRINLGPFKSATKGKKAPELEERLELVKETIQKIAAISDLSKSIIVKDLFFNNS